MFKKWILIAISMFVLLSLIVACAQTEPAPLPEAGEENVEVEALIIEKCGTCHTADRVFNENYTEQGWSDVFDEMIEKGAKVSPDEKEIMIDWLLAR
jgi:hypothetical protein